MTTSRKERPDARQPRLRGGGHALFMVEVGSAEEMTEFKRAVIEIHLRYCKACKASHVQHVQSEAARW